MKTSLTAHQPLVHQSERGFFDISIISFLLGAAAFYYFAGPLQKLSSAFESGTPSYTARNAEREPRNRSSREEASPLERFGAELRRAGWVHSAQDAYRTASSEAASLYRASANMTGDALRDLREMKDSAGHDLRGLGVDLSSLSGGGLRLSGLTGRLGGRRLHTRR